MKVVTIEDIEYINSSLFRGLGPMSFDFGNFGVTENSYLLIPYMNGSYEQFAEEVVERRRGEGGFKFENHEVDKQCLTLIKRLCEKIGSMSIASPTDEIVSALGLETRLELEMKRMMREELYKSTYDPKVEKLILEEHADGFLGQTLRLRNALGEYVVRERKIPSRIQYSQPGIHRSEGSGVILEFNIETGEWEKYTQISQGEWDENPEPLNDYDRELITKKFT